MIDAIFNLRRACKVATQLELEESALFSPDVSINFVSDSKLSSTVTGHM